MNSLTVYTSNLFESVIDIWMPSVTPVGKEANKSTIVQSTCLQSLISPLVERLIIYF